MLVSIVVPKRLPRQKRCDEEDHELLDIFNIFLMSMCSFCGGQHTDTSI